MFKGSVLLFAALVCLSFTVVLHHGWANYDQTKTLNFTGEILESSYENPHGMLKLQVDDKVWNVVLAPPSRMDSRGLKSDALVKGTKATVVGYPHKKVKDEMRAERITISGKTTELR
ncbi:hypothetical protein KK078_23955 [Fulvivirgaceae bacterium PWU37]|uniref:Uncharacterized protein n=2 Tax=Dawidia soli TaxID=2782352 RepID=A0AAP2DCS5_9BACT|nr:hypothetical protein [Dawidia soli]